MLRSKKKKFVSELEKIYHFSNSIIVTNYHGLTVEEMTNLRRSLRNVGAYFRVVKNTLSKIAASNVKVDYSLDMFSGPTAIAFSEDQVAAAKVVVDFSEANNKLKIIGGIVNDRILNVSEIQQLASLPSIDQLRSNILSLLQVPALDLTRVIQAPANVLLRTIQTYEKKTN